VYLIPDTLTLWTQENFNSAVTQGIAKSVVVGSDRLNQTLTIDTTGLPPGQYYLKAWNGESYNITLTAPTL
jgi:hypothetical protein